MEPAAISASPAVTTSAVESTAPVRPSASANGPVRPSARPMTVSRTTTPALKCCWTCGVCGISSLRVGYSGRMKTYLLVFASVLVAELGDKTQIATLLYATEPATSKLGVFLAAAAALVLSTAVAVVVGALLGEWISP